MNKFLKYLLCILFSILAINFLTNIVSFFINTNSYLIPAKITTNPKSENLTEIAAELETQINTVITDLKNENGEDYPALGIMYYRTVAHYSSVTVIQNFIFSLISGFTLGNIIFCIFISGWKSYKLAIALMLGLILLSILLTLSDIYTAIANSEELKFGFSEFFWNLEVGSIAYFITTAVIYAIKKITSTYYEIKYS